MSRSSAHSAEESAHAEKGRPFRIGVISDTHGKLSDEAFRALEGVDAIVHAGDIGNPNVLWQLMSIAPVTAVLGNTDYDLPGLDLGPIASVPLGGVRVFVTHDVKTATVPPEATLVISGHTHMPRVSRSGRRLYVNPGSASRSRGAGHTVAIVSIVSGGDVDAEIVTI
ncbi:MAG: metallophosphoesterase family protein [Coriobacteriales bacterium]|nr:metallophosphoesterase family protein [Coriobacteriales bacterium]